MANHSSSSSEPSLAALLSGIVNDAKNLLLQEFTIAKLEVQDELRKTKSAAISFGIGIGIAAIGGLLLILMIVHLLADLTEIPLWGCYGIVGGILLVIGIIFLVTGKQTAEKIDVIPPQTTETLKENARWLKEQTTSNRV